MKCNNTVTVLLSLHKRQKEFENQINCLLNQTKKVDSIMVWCSNYENLTLIREIEDKYSIQIKYGITNIPGVWGRFSFALNADTDFIYIMDDDIFPGPRYIEECVHKFYEYGGCVISPSGLKFQGTPSSLVGYDRYGWNSYPETEISDHEVDYGQHGWFFHKQFLPYFWKELPEDSYSKFAGEDMHLSHMVTKYTDHKTIVMKHNKDDLDSFANDPRNEAYSLGWDENGISTIMGIGEMEKILKQKVKNGWLR